MVDLLEKVSGTILLIFCGKSHNIFKFLIYYHSFYTYNQAVGQPGVNVSPNLVFIREKLLKLIYHPVLFVNDIFSCLQAK